MGCLLHDAIIFLFPRQRFRGRIPDRYKLRNTDELRGFNLVNANLMHKTNSIVMHAPKTAIFETAADLELWPKILPHYRYIHFLERGRDRNVVVMAARRSGIPISWTSEQIIDRNKLEIHFRHLKAWTK